MFVNGRQCERVCAASHLRPPAKRGGQTAARGPDVCAFSELVARQPTSHSLCQMRLVWTSFGGVLDQTMPNNGLSVCELSMGSCAGSDGAASIVSMPAQQPRANNRQYWDLMGRCLPRLARPGTGKLEMPRVVPGPTCCSSCTFGRRTNWRSAPSAPSLPHTGIRAAAEQDRQADHESAFPSPLPKTATAGARSLELRVSGVELRARQVHAPLAPRLTRSPAMMGHD
ncbi:hypothetical protein B0T25DRAFT_306687 [Lasiosphaeria hispida]|uniref:Uncharacterized protein n=1 Tax=Lasiosphaeria hispida TaxID=260671 RepID=A0AAJ0H932_9PEZI|nr:hypothetical protein B0T25DRAFT_306687 [Lasiosphaeria hispida]